MSGSKEIFHQFSDWIGSLRNWEKAAIFGGAALICYIPYRFLSFKPSASRKPHYEKDLEKDVVYLYQFPRSNYIPNISPFCLEVETWLRISDIRYKIPENPWNIRSKGGSFPSVEFNGLFLNGSEFILNYLEKFVQQASIDDHLSTEQKAVTRAFEALIEKSLTPSTWMSNIKHCDKIIGSSDPSIFGIFTPVFKYFSKKIYVSTISKKLAALDIGAYSQQEQIKIGVDDIRAISQYLGTKHFFHGFKPTKIDACIFANLAQIIYAPYESELRNVMKNECSNLFEYTERIKHRFWPDWSDATTKFSIDSNWKKRPNLRNGKRN